MKDRPTSDLSRKVAHMHVVLLACVALSMPCSQVYAQVSDDAPAQAPASSGEMPSPEDQPVSETGGASGELTSPEGDAAPAAIKPSATEDPWALFFPPPDSRFDWIQLTSGEWLKGELRGLYQYKLEFESDELDVLTFDWEDVAIIRSAGPQAVGYEDTSVSRTAITAYGQLTLIGNTATIGSSPNSTVIKRDQIITIAKGSQKEIDLWSGEISIGANVQRGNSNLSDASVYMLARRRSSVTRFSADYRGQFSRTNDKETSNSHRIHSYFDTFRTSRLYWRIIYAEYFRDRFQNIQNQVTLGTGLGYDIIRSPKTEWDVSAGIGALYKQAVSVEPGKDAANTAPALTLGTLFDTELTSRVDFLFNYRVQITNEENGKYISHLVTTLSTDITGNLDLDLTFIWDRTEHPQPAADGTVPDQDDYGMTIAISYEF